MVVAWVGNGIVAARILPVLREMGKSQRPSPAIVLPALLNLIVQLMNVAGWAWPPGLLAHVFGLFVYLYTAGVMFVMVILYRPLPVEDVGSPNQADDRRERVLDTHL